MKQSTRGMGIRQRLVISVTGFLILVNVVFWVFYYVSRTSLEKDLENKLVGASELVADEIRGELLVALSPGDEETRTYRNLSSRLRRVRDVLRLSRIMIVDPHSRLLVDADGQLRIGDSVFLLDSAAREIRSALGGGSATTVVYRGEDGFLYKSAYAPVRDASGAVLAVLVVEASAAFLGQIDVFRNVLFVVLLVSLIAVIVVGLLVSWSVVNPLLRLVRASREIGEGRYTSVQLSGSTEVRYLANALNDMAESIRAKEQKLKELYEAESERAAEIQKYAEYILESMANGILSVAADGSILVCNAETCRIFGVREADIAGKHYRSVAALSPLADLVTASLDHHETVRERQFDYLREDGGRFHLSVSSSPLTVTRKSSIAVNVVVTDQTVLLNLQGALKRKETLAAVGELAAHVAHEVRNPLGSMKIYMDLLLRDNISKEKRRSFIDKISSEITRLDGIVTEFLQYSAPSRMTLVEFDLLMVVEDAVAFAQSKEGPAVEFSGNYRKSASIRVRADRNQLMQMLLNLVINARDAMPGGGTVRIDVAAPDASGGSADRQHGEGPVCVSIHDDGAGIPPGDLEDIFKPFFSTKAQGSGLGLAIVQRVVENHGGRINVQSDPRRGTTITVTLPVRVESPASGGTAAPQRKGRE